MTRRFLMLCAVLLGCGDGNDPTPGPLVLRIEAMPATAGAMVVTVTGGPVAAVHADGAEITQHTDARGTHLFLMGALRVGGVITVEVPDVAQHAAYTVTVDQVADGTTYALLDPSAARLRVLAPE